MDVFLCDCVNSVVTYYLIFSIREPDTYNIITDLKGQCRGGKLALIFTITFLKIRNSCELYTKAMTSTTSGVW